MTRSDLLGTTSIIHDLALNPRCYEAMNLFFRASSWKLEVMKVKWFQIVADCGLLHKEDGFAILIGDEVKQAKEGRHMPGIKKLFQESENSSKPEYIFGHFFGEVGVLCGTFAKWFCIPLFINLQDGVKAIRSWEGKNTPSHVIQMIDNACEAARAFGKSRLLLDRYFLSVPALTRIKEHRDDAGAKENTWAGKAAKERGLCQAEQPLA